MRNSLSYGLLMISLIMLSGCATKEPTFGDRVLADGESRVAIAEQWEAGKRESEKGEKQVREGRKLVEKGRADLREGERLIASGNAAVQTHRQAYQGLSQTTHSISSPDSASDLNAKMKKHAKAWEAGESQIKKGRKLITLGNERIAEGEEDIREGSALLERGREKMTGAEKRYQSAN